MSKRSPALVCVRVCQCLFVCWHFKHKHTFSILRFAALKFLFSLSFRLDSAPSLSLFFCLAFVLYSYSFTLSLSLSLCWRQQRLRCYMLYGSPWLFGSWRKLVVRVFCFFFCLFFFFSWPRKVTIDRKRMRLRLLASPLLVFFALSYPVGNSFPFFWGQVQVVRKAFPHWSLVRMYD